MTGTENDKHVYQIRSFLDREGLADRSAEIRLTPLAGDGSSRLFFRIETGNGTSFCGVFPGNETAERGMAEARAAYHIGTHLKKRGLPVPAIHGFDPKSGFILFEDLGSTLLYDALEMKRQQEGDRFWERTREIYKEIVELLLYMQISGSIRFDRKWCWDTQRYDKKLMLERESGYFLQAFCRDMLGLKNLPPDLNGEFKELAARAGRQPAVYFLHRDFQARNLMLAADEIRIIDFQGGRLGPLGYDLASLLIDPYVQLPSTIQEELLEHYLEHLCKYGLDELTFLKGYNNLALQRNLQILGAFAFLSTQKHKRFFRQFILPASRSLQHLLSGPGSKNYPRLLYLSNMILELLEEEKDSAGNTYKFA